MTVIAEPWNWRGGRLGDAFLDAVRTVADLAAAPAVAAAWNEPGVLKDFSGRGLVGHMFWQELALPGMLSDPVPAEPVVSVREYYLQRVTWLDAGAHGAVSLRIRQGGEVTAADGHEALLAGVREAVGRLRTQVPDAPAVRPVRVSSWGTGPSTSTTSCSPGSWNSSSTPTTWRAAWAADKGYDYDHLRKWLRERHIRHRVARKGASSRPRGSADTAGSSKERSPGWPDAEGCTAVTSERPSTSWPSSASPQPSSVTADSPRSFSVAAPA